LRLSPAGLLRLFDDLDDEHARLRIFNPNLVVGQNARLLQPLALQTQLRDSVLFPEVASFADLEEAGIGLHSLLLAAAPAVFGLVAVPAAPILVPALHDALMNRAPGWVVIIFGITVIAWFLRLVFGGSIAAA